MTAPDLMERLKGHSRCINRLLSTVAPKYLVETTEKGEHYSRYLKNKSKDPEHKQNKKELMKEAKRTKLDPEAKRSLQDVQEQAREKRKRAAEDEDDEDDEDDDEEDYEDEDEDEDEDVEMDAVGTIGELKDDNSDGEDGSNQGEEGDDDVGEGGTGMDVDEDLDVNDMAGVASRPTLADSKMSNDVTELRKRLHERIQGMRVKRKADSSEGGATKKRKMEKPSKADKKKARKTKAKLDRRQVQAKGVQIATSRAELDHRDDQAGNTRVVKDDGQMVFSKFDFADGHGKQQKKKDYKHLLLKAEERLQKMNTLKKEDPEKAKEVASKKAFNRAMDMAEGKKQLDDPSLLKKAIKRQEKKKTKSAAEWGERLSSAKQAVKKSQDNRDANLKKRTEVKKHKKINGRGKKTSDQTKKKKAKAGPGFK